MGKGGGAVPNTAFVGASIPRQSRELLSREDLENVVAAVWRRRLGLSIHRLRGHAAAGSAVSANISLVGAGTAVAVLRAPFEVAAAAAVGVLGLHEDELAPGDVEDAFGELVVAIAQGIGDLLPGASVVGPASVVRGSELTTAVPGSPLMCDAALHCAPGPLHVSMWGRWPEGVLRTTPA